jgi:hypothetical protein
MRKIASLVAIPLILAVMGASSFAGVTCKSSDGQEHDKHSFTLGQCEALSDGSGAKSISHGNGVGSNGYASSQTRGVANATAGAHSAATALASSRGVGIAISNSRGLSMVDATGGRAKAVSSSGGNAQANASPGYVADASAKHGGSSTASATGSGNGFANAISDDGFANANTFGNCRTKATADTKGEADASCERNGSDVTVEATGGAIAQGSDSMAPVCNTSAGGTAMVISPMGNCDSH